MSDIAIAFIDHIAITAADIDRSCRFYESVLQARIVHEFVKDGVLLARQMRAGGAMFNVHKAGNGVTLAAARPTPGAIDICFRWDAPIQSAIEHLISCGVIIVEGPCPRIASSGETGMSVYFRDPDANLLEFLSLADES
ncbi:VOC family protein [Sphingomonadaceae bacterium G21617-S1]|nr:VOC family protein [Sphingomonadaceae bacterium G21617-S1]